MNFEGLLAASTDPEKAVRIAALRALARMALDSATRDSFLQEVRKYGSEDIEWSTWVPDPELRERIFALVDCPSEQERATAEKVIRNSDSSITKEFANLALQEYDPYSENLLADAEGIAFKAAAMGSHYQPEIDSLFLVYLVFLRRATRFWFSWVVELRDQHQYRPATQPPPWFPLNEGGLAVSRQIEWVVSRASLDARLRSLNTALANGSSRERFAAAQLLEWSARSEKEKEPARFGGGSGPEDILFDLLKTSGPMGFAPPPAPPMFSPVQGIGSPAPTPLIQKERHINFWIDEAKGSQKPLNVGQTYTAICQVGKPVSGSLIRDTEGRVPDSDVPPGGLLMNWTIIPQNVQLAAVDKTVRITPSGMATFTLLIPERGESDAVLVRLTPTTTDPSLLILIHTGGKLYRELEIQLNAGARVVNDTAVMRIADTDLRTTHEWTTPPGEITLHISNPGKATVFGYAGTMFFPPGNEVSIGTDKSLLSGPVASVRAAAEDFRKRWTNYLNDIDPETLLPHLQYFQPQYDWARLDDLADDAHKGVWSMVATSQESKDLAFYGRKLYDTLFPPGSDSRLLIEQLPAGQRINIIWRQDSKAGWIPHLPWALLYTGDVDGTGLIDATKFWGLRYRIDHVTYSPPSAASAALGSPLKSCCTSLLFFGKSSKEPATEQAEWQRKIWTSWNSVSCSRIVPDVAATQLKEELLNALRTPDSGTNPAAALYLFCHYGVDPGGKPLLRFGLDAADEASILREPDFGTALFSSRPLVFANACATAGTDVYSANTIMQAFIRRGCRAFIGTDCMVPAVMASRFAVVFFHFLLRLGDRAKEPMAAGEALTQARLLFWRYYKNIGGLFYSYLNMYDLFMADESEIAQLRRR